MFFSVLCAFLLISTCIENSASQRRVLSKCQCEANQVLVREECINKTTFINGFNKTAGIPFNVLTTEIGDVRVNDLTCDSSEFAKFLGSNVFLLEDGVVYDSTNRRYFSPDKYCFEHVLEQGPLTVLFKVCQTTPKVSQCCPKGFVLNDASECQSEKDFVLETQLVDGSTWKNVSGQIGMTECSEGYDRVNATLYEPSPSLVLLFSSTDEVILQKVPKGFESWEKYNSSSFCVAAIKNDRTYTYKAFYCKENSKFAHDKMCSLSDCVRKCCPEKHFYDLSKNQCIKMGDFVRPLPFTNESNDDPGKFYETPLITGAPLCDAFFKVDYENSTLPSLQSNGFLSVYITSRLLSPAEYCVEHLKTERGFEGGAFICVPSEDDKCSWRIPLLVTFESISLVFLLATFIVYVSISELRVRLPNKCLLSKISALFVGFLVLIVITTASDQLSPFGCRFAGIVEHITILASFFWLNVICYDMWSTIKSNRRMDNDQENAKRKFALYSLYAWGCPLLIGIIGIVVDSTSSHPNTVLRPGFGEGSCFFPDRAAQWAWFFSIIALLLFANIVFFVHIVIVLIRAQQSFRQVFVHGRTEGGGKNESNQQYWMYVKLFFVMGITWIAEVVSFEAKMNSYSCIFWVITSSINALRGLFIFIIFVCKKTTLRKIAKAWRPVLQPLEKMNILRMESSSERVRSGVSDVTGISPRFSDRKSSPSNRPESTDEVQMIPSSNN